MNQLRAIAFRDPGDHGQWVAQFLEVDIATQAKTLTELYSRVERLLIGHLIASEEAGLPLFQGLPQAPRRFWEMWESAKLCLTPAEGVKSLPVPNSLRSPEFLLKAAA